MRHEMKHDLDAATARKVAERAFEAYRAQYAKYDPVMRWTSETRAEASFSAKGITLRGAIELLPGAIAFDLEVPLFLRPFRGKAIEIMERELARWAAKAKRGELT
jgi:hypothetical protein